MLRKIALALAVTLATTGCAEAADDVALVTGEAAAAALRATPDAAAAAGSGRFEMTMSFRTPEGDFDLLATGAYAGDRMQMEMDFGSMFAGLAAATGEEVPPGFDEPMRLVMDGDTAYIRFPMLEALTGTQGWLRASAEELGAAGSSFGVGSGANDPAQMLDALRGVAGEVVDEGPDEVRGVATTRYRATVDLAKALEAAPTEQRAQLEAQLEGLDADLAEIPVQVWIDGDGLARRLAMDLDALAGMAGGIGEGATASMTIDFFDYGDDVAIEIPDPADTQSFTDVLGAFGGAG